MKLRIYRCDPSTEEAPRYDTFEIPLREKMSILDALFAIQAEQDPTLSFRHSCRAGMCGTCAINVNGVPRWSCRTSLASLGKEIVTLEPLRHFPVIKDLMVDMEPFFDRFRRVLPYVIPREESEQQAIIPPTEPGRARIAPNLECIGCGCCYAACGVPGFDADYLGPHALNRAFTLVHDRRDAARDERLLIVDNEHACWRCHTQTACMEVCPKEINTTDAIQDLKREVLAFQRDRVFVPEAKALPAETPAERFEETPESPARRDFLQTAAAGAVCLMALAVGFPLAGAVLSPARESEEETEWIDLGSLEAFPVGKMVETRCDIPAAHGWYNRPAARTVYVIRRQDGSVSAFSSHCTHLGCQVRWVEASRSFLCPCHGGIFDENGKVVVGPPPKPLERLAIRIEGKRICMRGSL